jgi:hypothetical protein
MGEGLKGLFADRYSLLTVGISTLFTKWRKAKSDLETITLTFPSFLLIFKDFIRSDF